jgi:hypothetical protein
LGGGAGTSRARDQRSTGSGVTVKHGGTPPGTGTTRSTALGESAGTTAKATSAAPPLQVRALAHGSERGPREQGRASPAAPVPRAAQHVASDPASAAADEQHGDEAGADWRDEQHAPSDRSPAEPLVRTSATPAASPAFRRTTQAPQVALPGRIEFAAAIQSASAKRTPIGGRIPRSKAQTRRWCGVWQQHAVQHSAAPAQPQPQSWQGYGATDPSDAPSSRPSVDGDGMTPIDAMAMRTSMAAATARWINMRATDVHSCMGMEAGEGPGGGRS